LTPLDSSNNGSGRSISQAAGPLNEYVMRHTLPGGSAVDLQQIAAQLRPATTHRHPERSRGISSPQRVLRVTMVLAGSQPF
jgi:hypothetical protein